MPDREELAQVRALTRAFLARFFESDTTTERTDPARSFLWLIAVLGAPGLLQPFYRQFAWENIARYRGGQSALHVAVLFDKSVYLSLTFVAIAIVAALRWQSLVVDRRDALVLGPLPLRTRTIVAGKLGALGAYTLLLAVGMHLGSAALYGLFLGSLERPVNVLPVMAGHLIAGVGQSILVMASVAGLQAVSLAVLGPIRFARMAVTFQMGVMAAALTTFVLMPGQGQMAFSTFGAGGVPSPGWAAWLPPLWFLGIYEGIAGTGPSGLTALGRTGWIALAAALTALALAAPLAGQRVLRAALAPTTPAQAPPTRRLAAAVVRVLGRTPSTRAAIQFALATIGRVAAPRLALALSGAVGVMGLVPVIAAIATTPTGEIEPTTSILALPFLMVFFWLLGLRLAIRTPGELSGRWMFEQTELAPTAGRTAAWRIALLFGVIVPTLAVAPIWVWLWGPAVGIARVLSAFTGGILALEVFLWGYVHVPCSSPIGGSGFKARTLALLLGFEVFCFESAAAQVGWQGRIEPVLVQTGFFAVLAIAVHIAGRRAAAVNAVVDEHAEAQLDLHVVGGLPLTILRRADQPDGRT